MFETLDYRNARYQGQVKNGQPNGIGIIIDYNYLFCLAEWQDGRINGHAFIVFPDSRIFCGRIYGNQLSGLCSFYLQDRIQIFANYSQKQGRKNNFVAILPFCKVLLQIDRNGPQPKVCHHQTYNTQQNSLGNKLESIFGKRLDLSQFQGWKDFLFLNLIKTYSKKLYWKQKVGIKTQQIFFGLKHLGLGAKILNLLDEKEITAYGGDCFVVASMGNYSPQQQLTGLGKQLVQYSMNKMQEQGCYGEWKSEIIQYPRKERPLKGERIFVHQLKTSYNFNNTFFDLKICYELLSKYEKINVEIMQQNRKIAQIIIQKKNDNVVLAEIENRKQRRLTPQRSQRAIQSEYRRVKQPKEVPQTISMNELTPEQQRLHRYPSQTLSVNPQTKKSIYSSAEKKQKYKRNSPKRLNETVVERYRVPQYKKSQPFLNLSLQKSNAFKYNDNFEKQSRALSKNIQNKKYLYQTILEDPSSLSISYLQAKDQIKPTYFQRSTYHLSSKYDSKQKSLQKYSPKTIKKREYPNLYSINQNSSLHYPNQSRSRQESPPLFNRYRDNKQHKEQKDPNSSLIKYFNRQIQDQYPSYSPLNRGFINDAPNNTNWTLGNTPKKQKTPGKIVTFKKKQEHNTYYQ